MLNRFNQFMEKWIFLVTPICVVIGVTFADITIHWNVLVPYVFAFMTFVGALKSSFHDVVGVFRHPLALLCSIACIHVVMPLIVFGLGALLFPNNMNLVTGMVLEFCVPSAVTALMWGSIYHGNSSLSLSLVIVDTILAPFFIPATLHIFVGGHITIDASHMMEELIFMIALPAIVAMCFHQFGGEKVKTVWPGKLAPFSKMCIMFLQISNSAKAAPYIRHLNKELMMVVLVMFFLAAFGYGLGWIAAMLIKRDVATTVSMTFGVGMRNISAGAVVATAYFPAEVVFPVIIATLFQQVLAAIYGTFIRKFLKS